MHTRVAGCLLDSQASFFALIAPDVWVLVVLVVAVVVTRRLVGRQRGGGGS